MFGCDGAGKRRVLDGFSSSGCQIVVTGSVTFLALALEYAQANLPPSSLASAATR